MRFSDDSSRADGKAPTLTLPRSTGRGKKKPAADGVPHRRAAKLPEQCTTRAKLSIDLLSTIRVSPQPHSILLDSCSHRGAQKRLQLLRIGSEFIGARAGGGMEIDLGGEILVG